MTGTRRDPNCKDRRQARSERSWMLNEGEFGAMTAILDVWLPRRAKLLRAV